MVRWVQADTVYLSDDEFLKQTFSELPPPSVLWLDNPTQEKLTAALGHRYPQARIRYWRVAAKTAWLLEETGKEYPIGAGFVVTDNHIERAQVLVYRESRGEEIHLPAFLRQFIGAQLDGDHLSRKIDGITGATLSVNAMQRMAQAALVLNQAASNQAAP
ncbi:MAG: FMN-binding protein [Verrucomicrobiaceae bacterium]|nr:FMN-binding protein [Verrucomicrobiaceae bacterium]